MSTRSLSDTDRAILDLEARTYRTVGAKERDIRRELDLSPMRYHVLLSRLIDLPEALAYAPAVVRRARERTGR
ncbi:MAG: DUF3263 domain-containing protein [Dermabacter sp.]|nr:DUF3263 domain-containing protein [Dermabacter sp.]